MQKTFRLVSVQLWAVLGDMLSIGKSGKKRPAVMYAGVLFFTLLMSAVSFFYSLMLGTGLKMFDSLDILPAIMVSAACIVTLMTTIFKIKGTIFGFRDYDLVMSLPVSTGAVVACRLIILYSFNILFTIIMMLPMMIAYGILAGPGVMFYVMSLVLIFIIPLVPIIAASVVGTVIAYVASKFRHNNILNIVFSIGILIVFIGLPYTFKGNGQELVDMGKAITEKVYSMYPLARLYTTAVTSADWLSFFLFIAISILAFMLYTIIVKLLFKRINTLIMTGRSRTNFKMGELKTSSPVKALYIKELRRYFASTIYVLNTGIGIILLTLAAVAGLFVNLESILGGPQVLDLIKDNAILYLLFCILLSCTTMSSISLEGKNLWIIKTLPVSPMTVFHSKIAVNLTICLPALFDAVIIGFIFRLSVVRIILLVLITAACAVFIALYGLIINLLLPNFLWTAEVVVVKQSAASLVTIFSGFVFVGIMFLFITIIPTITGAYLAFLLLIAIMDVVLYYVLNNYGIKRFYSL